jgi:hypothetical protein
MAELSEAINAVLWLVVAIFALIIFLIFQRSYKRVKDKKIFYTTVAFFIFFVKAMLLGMRLFMLELNEEPWFLDDEFWWSIAAMLDVVIITLIFYPLSKRANNA